MSNVLLAFEVLFSLVRRTDRFVAGVAFAIDEDPLLRSIRLFWKTSHCSHYERPRSVSSITKLALNETPG